MTEYFGLDKKDLKDQEFFLSCHVISQAHQSYKKPMHNITKYRAKFVTIQFHRREKNKFH